MKVDLVMWTKNGARTLPYVLNRIREIIPAEAINSRLIVDDRSTDETREIAKSFGWDVMFNAGKGISDGANTALAHVETDYFTSFEQDLFLARNWWANIPRYFSSQKNIAAASGIRFADRTIGLRKLQKYVAKREGELYKRKAQASTWLRPLKSSQTKQIAPFTGVKTLDNTMYDTEKIRKLGGFPKMERNTGIDVVLDHKIWQKGYCWAVDYNVQSVHFRENLEQELKHQYWYGTAQYEIKSKIDEEQNHFVLFDTIRSLYSPFTGLFAALKTKEATIAYVVPLIRLFYIKGLLESGRHT
jgi:glycosyltransferase involved in cell wall biosynthesis